MTKEEAVELSGAIERQSPDCNVIAGTGVELLQGYGFMIQDSHGERRLITSKEDWDNIKLEG